MKSKPILALHRNPSLANPEMASAGDERPVAQVGIKSPFAVHVLLWLDVGGLERIVLDLIRAHGEGGRGKTSVLCLARPGTLAGEAAALGAIVTCVGKKAGLDWKVSRRIEESISELGAQVVHTHQIGALFYAGPVARRLGLGVVHTEHGKHYAARRRTRWLGRIAARNAARFCCVSHDIAREVVACGIAPARKVHVVPNGIDVERFGRTGDADELRRALGIPEEATVVGTVGRLTEIKRQDLLIQAFSRLDGLEPAPHLVIVGDGPEMHALRDLAASLEIAARVHFVGYQADPAPYLHAMDIFALTSRSEGMPLSILEAWAAGKPVVASRVGGIPELVDDGRTGLLFPSGDGDRLADVLRDLIADRGRAQALGARGAEEVRNRYSLAAMSDSYEYHYRQALAERRGVRS